jgi:hypothetical protein
MFNRRRRGRRDPMPLSANRGAFLHPLALKLRSFDKTFRFAEKAEYELPADSVQTQVVHEQLPGCSE